MLDPITHINIQYTYIYICIINYNNIYNYIIIPTWSIIISPHQSLITICTRHRLRELSAATKRSPHICRTCWQVRSLGFLRIEWYKYRDPTKTMDGNLILPLKLFDGDLDSNSYCIIYFSTCSGFRLMA